MADVYVVFGGTGEYSDHQYWTVAAYVVEDQANAHAARANEWCRDNGFHDGTPEGYCYADDDVGCPWDEGLIGNTGTEYTVVKVPLGGYPKVPNA